jgi:hypothetical protein
MKTIDDFETDAITLRLVLADLGYTTFEAKQLLRLLTTMSNKVYQ